MRNLNVRTSKAAEPKKRSPYVFPTPTCRRCGDGTCSCSDEELDAGGPAPI